MPPSVPARRGVPARTAPPGASRALGEGLADATAGLYRHIEQLLIAHLARQLRAPVPAGQDWTAAKLQAIMRIRSYAEGLLAALDEDMPGHVEQAILLAYERGGRAALAELARHSGIRDPDAEADRIRTALPGADAITRLIRTAVTTLRGTHTPILRWALDAYRTVVAEDAAGVLAGTHTRLRAAQVAWERFLTRGITGFTDRSGRRWELASYVEMAMRSTTAQAAVEGHMDRLAERGIDLVIVSDAPQECKRCRPWEGKVLARSGAGGARTVQVEHATQDRLITVSVAGSLTEAIAAGLMHPNCRHSISAYLPGVTKPITNTADPQGDRDRQHLRALERKVREWKRREEGALTPQARAQARARVRAYQARIREHVDATGLHRQRHREQIGAAR